MTEIFGIPIRTLQISAGIAQIVVLIAMLVTIGLIIKELTKK